MDYKKTNPILLNARSLVTEYSLATGTQANILDHNYMPISELKDKMPIEKNICLFCAEQQKPGGCRELHMKAVKGSIDSGGTQIYECPHGFTFWTSPIYHNDQFIGALLGSTPNGKEPQGVKALAELMLLCAQSLSTKNGDGHKTMKSRSFQQSGLPEKIEELKNQYPTGSSRPEYPLDKEQKLLDALRHGDTALTRKILNEILAFLFFATPDDWNHIRYRAIELAVLFSHESIQQGFTVKSMLENDSRNIMLIQETKNIEELAEIMYRVADDLAEQINSFQGTNHASALKKAENYILENITRKISLEEIAGASGFSAPYFSTIFKEETGENLSSYLNRIRVEKAAALLIDTNLSLCRIAQTCGFKDQGWFSKIFKLHTGKSPGKFRSQKGKTTSKIPETGFAADFPRGKL